MRALAAALALFTVQCVVTQAADWEQALKAEHAANAKKIAAITAKGNPVAHDLMGALKQSESVRKRIAAHNARKNRRATPAQTRAYNREAERLNREFAPYKRKMVSLRTRLQAYDRQRDRLIARNKEIERKLSRRKCRQPVKCSSNADCKCGYTCGLLGTKQSTLGQFGVCQPP